MGLFNFGKKNDTGALEKMIAAAEERKNNLLASLHTGEVADCPVYKDGHWEMQYLLGAPDKLMEVLQQGRAVNAAVGFPGMNAAGMPFVMALFRFDDDPKLSYATLAAVESVGVPGTAFADLKYMDLLLSQQTIPYILKGSKGMLSASYPNMSRNSPQLQQIKAQIDTALASSGPIAYGMTRNTLLTQLRSQQTPGQTEYETMGQTLWSLYEQTLQTGNGKYTI